MKLEQIENLDYVLKVNNNYYKEKMGYESGLMDDEKKIKRFQEFGFVQGLYLKNDDNENIGYIIYQLINKTNIHNQNELSLYLCDIYIDENYQKKGLANELINSTIIIDYMSSKLNYDNIQIYSTIETNNLESLKLHLKNGFKIFEIEAEEYTINGKELDGYLLYKNYKGIDNFEKLNKQNNLNDNIKESLNIVENNKISTLKIDSYNIPLFESKEFIKRLNYLNNFTFKSADNVKFQIVERSLNKSFDELKIDIDKWILDLKNSTNIIKESFKGVCEVEYDNGIANIIMNSKNNLTIHPFRDINNIIEEFNYRCQIMNNRIEKEKSELKNENEELENNDFIR